MMRRLNTSRPSWSVPARCAALGGSNASETFRKSESSSSVRTLPIGATFPSQSTSFGPSMTSR